MLENDWNAWQMMQKFRHENDIIGKRDKSASSDGTLGNSHPHSLRMHENLKAVEELICSQEGQPTSEKFGQINICLNFSACRLSRNWNIVLGTLLRKIYKHVLNLSHEVLNAVVTLRYFTRLRFCAVFPQLSVFKQHVWVYYFINLEFSNKFCFTPCC